MTKDAREQARLAAIDDHLKERPTSEDLWHFSKGFNAGYDARSAELAAAQPAEGDARSLQYDLELLRKPDGSLEWVEDGPVRQVQDNLVEEARKYLEKYGEGVRFVADLAVMAEFARTAVADAVRWERETMLINIEALLESEIIQVQNDLYNPSLYNNQVECRTKVQTLEQCKKIIEQLADDGQDDRESPARRA